MTTRALSVAQPAAAPEVPFQQIERMALAATKSGLFGVKNADQALALMLVAQAEGMHPALAARDYHIIQGRAALKADTMLARFQQAGGKVQWHDYTDAKVSASFSHPQAGSVTVDWDIERARRAGLGGKDNWKTYPRAMLRSRVISEGVRTCYPGVAVGTYTVEEVQDMEPLDITPQSSRVEAAVQAAQDVSTALTVQERGEHITAIAMAATTEDLSRAFASAWTHGKQSNDKLALDDFKRAYDMRKAELSQPAEVVA